MHYTIDSIEHTVDSSNRLGESHYVSRGSDELIVSDKQNQICSDLKHMLVWWKAFAEEHSIAWWMTAGSLLGTVRHQGLIPWDDDIDVSIYIANEQEFYRLKKICGTYGDYAFNIDGTGFSVLLVRDTHMRIDVFTYERRVPETTKLEYSCPYTSDCLPTFFCADLYPKCYHDTAELFDSDGLPHHDTMMYESIEVPVPKNSHMVLARWYGSSCITELFYDNHVERAHSGLSDVLRMDSHTITSRSEVLYDVFGYLGLTAARHSNAEDNKRDLMFCLLRILEPTTFIHSNSYLEMGGKVGGRICECIRNMMVVGTHPQTPSLARFVSGGGYPPPDPLVC